MLLDLVSGFWPVLLAALIAGAYGLYWRANRTRPCPRCGRGVEIGILQCSCGFDFKTIG